jgi:hypothetical protein
MRRFLSVIARESGAGCEEDRRCVWTTATLPQATPRRLARKRIPPRQQARTWSRARIPLIDSMTYPCLVSRCREDGRVVEHGGNEDQAVGALLHDAAEDQGGSETLEDIRRRFGDAVAEIVADCTDAWTEPKPDWRPRKEAYLAKADGAGCKWRESC